MRATVIGAGIGGLAAARALALRGARVTVLEQAPEIAEVGAGLQMSPNALAVLRGLGLEQALEESGAVRARAVVLSDYRRGEVARLDLTRLEDQSYFFVHRADLIALLERGAREAGVEIELGAQVAAVRDAEGAEPPVAVLEGGGERRADLIVGADGLHSRLRPVLNGAAEPFFTGQVAWRALIPNEAGRGPEAATSMDTGERSLRATSISRADWKRSSRSRRSALSTSSATAAGTFGARSRTSGASCMQILTMTCS